MPSAILLAAGLSTRMGEANKLLLPWKKGVIIEHLIQQIVESNVAELIIVVGHQSEKVQQFIPQHPKIKTVLNETYQKGMTTSIQTGVSHSNSTSKGYMICLGDQVLMETTDYNYILQAWEKAIKANPASILLPTYQQQKGNPVIFSAHYKNAILQHQATNGCKAIVQANNQQLQSIEMPNNHVLTDVDTPEAYEQLINRRLD